jgi:predicted exporter
MLSAFPARRRGRAAGAGASEGAGSVVTTSARRWSLLGAWLLALGVLAAFVFHSLRISTDLRSFMPPPRTPDQKLLMEQIGEGPGSRLLLLAIDGAPETQLAELSRGLVARLHGDEHFEQAINGAFDPSALDEKWLPYRWLLSPTLDTHALDAAYLADQLGQRVEELASPAAALLKPLLPRDPTLETLALAERWSPPKQPALRDGVWFSSDGAALLLAQTRGAGFDPAAQGAAIDALQAAFHALSGSAKAKLTISGPGWFTVLINAQTRAEADRIGAVSTIGFVLLLLLAYRSLPSLLLAGLPVLSGGLAGVAALALAFGSAHGITLAFGFTLLGVAQEYPIRVLSHRRAGEDALASVRALWPLLATAIASAAIAYLAFFASGVGGLQQLAVFTITGLLAAGLSTRYLLPRVLPMRFRDAADTPGLARAARALDRLPRPRWLPWVLAALGLVVLWRAPGPMWQNDLAALTPVPQQLLLRDAKLRGELGAPDVRYLLVLRAVDADGVLALSESLEPRIAGLVREGVLDAAELPSRYLPSLARQRARQAKLPARATLAAALAEAERDLPFRAGVFEPFLADVETARTLAPLDPATFAKSQFGARLASMLLPRDEGWLGLATLAGVHDAEALARFTGKSGGSVRLLDLKSASESLVVAYRERILRALGVALVLLALTVVVALRSARRALHVLAPMSLATLLVIVVERAGGLSLSLFHLVAVTLAAGLGLHYALFFERPVADAAEGRRTLHATVVCVLSALLVFGLQAWSSLPVLRAIGLTVALGVGFHFCLSILMARQR